jgi:hypothetical protein
MVFWQLTINARDSEAQAQFWAAALGYRLSPPAEPDATWWSHYRGRLGEKTEFSDRIFDPAGLQPPIWFQAADDANTGPTRLHLDLYPTGRDNSLPQERRIEIVDAKVAELTAIGATVVRSCRDDDPDDPMYFVTLRDPEGNEFCVS